MDIKTDLIQIPGIGKRMAGHLADIGYPNIESIKGQDPEEITLIISCVMEQVICRANVFYIATVWRCITPITMGSFHPTSGVGTTGRIEPDLWMAKSTTFPKHAPMSLLK